MKITRRLRSPNFTLRAVRALALGLCVIYAHFPSLAFAGWEVGVLFLGAQEPAAYQADVEANLRELESTRLSTEDRVGIYREAPGFTQTWDSQNKIWAQNPTIPKVKSLLNNPTALAQFFSSTFVNPTSERLLVIYSHGLGFEGLKGIDLLTLNKNLTKSLPSRASGNPPLDVLWLDACFMGNLETAYELRGLSRYLVSSQEAEFSAGLPFQFLGTLLRSAPSQPEKLALTLAEKHLDSYSYLKNGSQKDAVETSAATISVIETAKLEGFAELLTRISQALTPLPAQFRARLSQKIKRITMDEPTLVDFGALLIQIRSLSKFAPPAVVEPVEEALNLLELLPGRRLQSQPRVWLEPPTEGARLVFGFDNWTKGHKGDTATLDRLPPPLSKSFFIYGTQNQEWPVQSWPNTIQISPFLVGVRFFNYYFVGADGGVLSQPAVLSRRADRYFFVSSKSSSPIRAAGYTQSLGKKSEKYTGVTISDPTRGLPSLNYSDLQLVLKTQWTNF